MKIGRISFPEGKSFTENALFQLIDESAKTAPRLAPGEFDITPRELARGPIHHNLIVFPEGNAVYREIPQETGAAILETTLHSSSLRRGGRTTKIPEEQEMVIIASQESGGGIKVFEVIVNLPD